MKPEQDYNRQTYNAEIKCCMICDGTQNLNKDGLCPFCQLDIDLSFYDN